MTQLDSLGTDRFVRVPRLERRTKLLYAVGGSADTIKSVLFALFTLYFYTNVVGLTATWVGVATAVGLVWDAIIDPYVGFLSDRTRTRLGRRHLFMLVGAMTMGVSFWAYFSPPQGLGTGALFAWLLVTNLMVRTSTSVFSIPYFALGAELSQDYHERTAITATRGLVGLLGTMAAASLSFLLFFPDRIPGIDPKTSYEGYPAMGLVFGVVMSLVALTATLGTLGAGTPPQESDSGADAPTLLHGFAQALRHRSFRYFWLSVSFFFLAVVINQILAIHFYTYYVNIIESTILSRFQVAFYLGGIVGLLFWLALSRRIEKHHLYVGATAGMGLLLASAFFLLGEGHLFGTGNPLPVLVGQAVGGFLGSVLWFMPASMIADVADEDELVGGRRREGAFFGIYFFGQQVGSGLSLLFTGLLLDRFAGLVPGQVEQSAQTVARIGWLYSILPALLVGIAALLATRYTLGRKRILAIQAELAYRKELDVRGVIG